jgi:alkylation response protein AidB-like acyl-CoA dehydrogenase
MTEPEVAGSDPRRLRATAVRDGDHYVINGHKWFTSGAHGASFAIVMAMTNPENASPYLRFSQVIVPTDRPRFRIEPRRAGDGRRRQPSRRDPLVTVACRLRTG